MTIKTKLLLNVNVVIIAIAAVSITSFLGMKFVKGKLSYLTERSTPFQMRTEQFEKGIQAATAELIKMANASSRKDFEGARGDAEKAVQDVEKLQHNLDALSGENKSDTYAELSGICKELTATTDARLKAEEESSAAYRAISGKIRETDVKLKAVDSKIKALQSSRAGAYLTAVKETDKISARLKSIETLMANLTKLQLLCHELQAAKVAKTQQNLTNKIATLSKNILQNGNVKETKGLKNEVALLVAKTEDLAKTVPGGDDKKSKSVLDDVDEKMGSILATVEEVSQSVDESHDVLYAKQGTLLNSSHTAAGILSRNSDLMTMGTSLEGLAGRLFITDSGNELDAAKKEISAAFARIGSVQTGVETELRKLNAQQEIRDQG